MLLRCQFQIDSFLEECDRLIEEYFPGSHLYKNDQRSAMAYLFLNDPDTHYLYKATECKYLADCVKNIGSGELTEKALWKYEYRA